MKKFILFIFMCGFWVSTFTQNIGISNDAAFITPQSPLHIYWTSDGNLLQLSRSSVSNTGLTFSVNSGDFSILNRNNNALIFGTNATERMRITNTGDVGIGTTTPSAQLHTTGTVRFQNYVSGANGAILRTNASGDLSITNFSGTANDVLLGTGSFGSMNTLAWQLTGNSGTNPASNYLGTTDAQDLVIRTQNSERMRIMSSGAVRIGYGTAATNALQVGGYGTSNPTVFMGSDGGGAPGYGYIGLYGTSYGTLSTILRGGGLSFFNSRNQYVFGQTTAVDPNDFVAVVGNGTYPWALNAYTSQNNAGAIYGQGKGKKSYGVWGEVNHNTSIGVIGNNSSTTANTLACGVQGQTANPSGSGVVGINSSTTADVNATGVSGYTTNSSGTAIYGFLNNTTPDENATGVLGITNNPAGDAGFFINNATTGTNNGNGIYAQTSQSSGAGVFSINSHANGTGLIAIGNNLTGLYLTSGSGGAFTGDPIGIAVFKKGALTNNEGAGYFLASSTSGAGVYVAYHTGGTNYKIIDVGTFGGSVSTDVWGLTNDTNDRKIMFAPEAPEIVFHDFGVGKLINGKAHITLDPIFSRNIVVNDEHPLRVFIQLEGDCNGVYVTNKTKEGFDVIELNNGTSNVEFSWFVIANRSDYINPITNELISKHEGVRYPQAPNPPKIETLKDNNIKLQKVFKRDMILNIVNDKLLNKTNREN
ncbi:MAG TPA: hypothetical protein PLP65_03170 [Bacteroidales bacterium]|nr:hypothetical protein [Bacteroidales bacterium]